MSRKSKAAEFLQEGYDISVLGRNVIITDALRDYAIDKVSKIEKFSNRIIDVVVTMDVQKLDQIVDIVLKVDNTKIKGQATTDNMYASVDKAVDKIESQLRRYKNKINDHHAKNVATVDMNVNVLHSPEVVELLDVNFEIEDENKRRLMDRFAPHKIVKREKHPLKTLTDGEAIMKIELSKDNFMIYRSEETLRLKVIYRRTDGDFGVIEVEG